MNLPKAMLVGGVAELDISIAILNNPTGNRAITGLITPTRTRQRAALNNAKGTFKPRHTNTVRQTESSKQASNG